MLEAAEVETGEGGHTIMLTLPSRSRSRSLLLLLLFELLDEEEEAYFINSFRDSSSRCFSLSMSVSRETCTPFSKSSIRGSMMLNDDDDEEENDEDVEEEEEEEKEEECG